METELYNVQLKQLIRKAIGPRSMRSFAQECGISNEHLCRILKNDYDKVPSTKTLQKIAQSAMNNVTLEDLLVAAGKLSKNEQSSTRGEANTPGDIPFGSDVYSFDKEVRELLIAIRGAKLSLEYVENIERYLDLLLGTFCEKFHNIFFDLECSISYVPYCEEYEYYERGAARHSCCSNMLAGKLSCITRNSFNPDAWARAEIYFCLFISLSEDMSYHISDTDWGLPDFAIAPFDFTAITLSKNSSLREYLESYVLAMK